MQLDKETVENSLQFLSKVKFDGICRIVLSEYFHLETVNVDRRGDGGGDWIIIPYDAGKRAFFAQSTIQDAQWKSKCLRDAQKAITNFDCKKFLFLTSRRRDSVDLLDVENAIQDKYDIPASCLGAVEIADILISRKLAGKAFAEAGMGSDVSAVERPDHREQLLFGVFSLSAGASALRNHVYDDALICVLAQSGPVSREHLITATISTLQCGEHREGPLSGRVDSLLTRSALRKDAETDLIHLAEETEESLAQARAIYDEQFSDLQVKIEEVLRHQAALMLDSKMMPMMATLSSRAMIVETIRQADKAGISIQNTALLDQLGEPLAELRKVLKGSCKEKSQVDHVLADLLAVTNKHPLVLRLSHEVLYFVLDGVNPIHQAKAFGVGSWEKSEAVLDASVAIPFLCSRFTRPSSGRFSRGATSGVAALQRVGCTVFLPRDYLAEAAVHLLHAVDYCRTFDDPDVLVASPNGYVSHYHTLRRNGAPVPRSLIEFLLGLAPSLLNANACDIVSQIMNDLQGRFSDLGIRKMSLGCIDSSYMSNINDQYAQQMRPEHAARESILMEHDTRTLAWMKQCRAQGDYGKICLTWDELMMAVARDDANSGWVVTPHQIADLITMGTRRDEGALLSVIHELASTRTLHDDLVGKLLDEAIMYARDGRLEWQVVSELSDIRRQLHERALLEGAPSKEDLKEISDNFWKRHGIDSSKSYKRSNVTAEEIQRAIENA